MAWLISPPVGPPHYMSVVLDDERVRAAGMLGLNTGLAVSGDLPLPRSGYIERPRKRLPAFAHTGGYDLVDERFRREVEAVEPGIHQFFPFSLRHGRAGPATDETYYILNVASQKNAIDLEKSKVSVTSYSMLPDKISGIIREGSIVISKTRLGSAAMWIDVLYRGKFFISDDLMRRFEKAKVRGYERIYCAEC